MKKVNFVWTFLLTWALAFSLASCGGGGGGGSTPSPTPDPGENVTDKGILMGNVTDESGAALGSVTVSVDGQTITSNEQGFFVVEKVTPGTDKQVACSKSGYMNGIKHVNVVAGQETFHTFALKKVGTAQLASGSVSNTVADSRYDGKNGSITIPANSVVNAGGQHVASYSTEISTLLPSDSNFTILFPGKFLGGSAPGSIANPKPLRSYGMVNVDLKDAQGNKLFLASGATATLHFPIDSDPVHDPGTATVPIWYLDEASGIWIQEGTATRSGSFYTAQVHHLTPWNCDVAFPQSIKSCEVVGLDGVPIVNALVIVDGTGYRQQGYTNSSGRVDIICQPWDRIRVWAEKGNIRSAVITETAADVGQVKENRIELVEPLISVTMIWGQNPADLDAHMTGPLNASSRFHVYWYTKGSLTDSPYCALDTDDQSSFGPEIVTVSKLQTGMYQYSVFNYSSQAAFPMQNSSCVVNLVIARSGTIRRYNIPSNNAPNGNLWVVFKVNVDSGGGITVSDVNQFKAIDRYGAGID